VSNAGSRAERRALVWCLGVGLLAVALGAIERRSQSPFLSEWSASSGIRFWPVAAIIAVDAVAVVAGGHGPRAIKMLALSIPVAVLAVVALAALPGGCVLVLMGGLDESWTKALFFEGFLALVGTVQWFSLKAVAERE
jgi:hypothetical protein